MPASNAAVIFAKPPVPGRVKTRLLGILSARQAARLHRACLEDTVALVDSLPGCAKWLMVAGTAKTARRVSKELRLGPGWSVGAQRGRDLGERLERALKTLFDAGVKKVIVVGSDTPWMGRPRLLEALRFAKAVDVVVGPAADGGYYLVGGRRLVPEIFRKIPWGSPQVLPATLRALAKSQSGFRLLPRDFDLDRPKDLRLAAGLLREKPERAPALARWISQWGKSSGSSRRPKSSRRNKKRRPGRG